MEKGLFDLEIVIPKETLGRNDVATHLFASFNSHGLMGRYLIQFVSEKSGFSKYYVTVNVTLGEERSYSCKGTKYPFEETRWTVTKERFDEDVVHCCKSLRALIQANI